MDTSITIRRVTPDSDRSVFDQLAEVHRQEIDQGFLTSLGPGFLSNLYRGIVRTDSGFVFAAVRGDRVLGFICGAEDTGRVFKQYALRRGWIDGWRVAPKLITPTRLYKAAETLLYPAKTQQDNLPRAEVMNFCVRGEQQGRGFGRRLFAELCDECRRRGVPAIRIVTGERQQSAQRFYEKFGAERAEAATVHRDTAAVVYTLAIPPAPANQLAA